MGCFIKSVKGRAVRVPLGERRDVTVARAMRSR